MVTTTAGTVVTPRPTASMAPQRDHTVTVALATALPIVAVIIAITVIIVVVFIVGSRYWKRVSKMHNNIIGIVKILLYLSNREVIQESNLISHQ